MPGVLPLSRFRFPVLPEGVRLAFAAALACTLGAVFCLVFPVYIIRPFRPQDPTQLAQALTVRGPAPWLSAAAAVAVLLATFLAWQRVRSWIPRILFGLLSLIAVAAAGLTHLNIFEIMFHPYPAPQFAPAGVVAVEAEDKVLSVTIQGETHAYPIRAMGYHHIVNDVVGGSPIAVSYCTLCHTGLVWSRVVDGQTLYFRLAGINNGNALLRDTATSSIWQQSTGQAIFGPLKGRQLALIHSDELSFALWRQEKPTGLVLKSNPEYADQYETKDWDAHIDKYPTVVDTRSSGIAPHELMLGVTVDGSSKAYPVKAILATKLMEDKVGGVPILLLVGPDGSSIRVFRAALSQAPMTFLLPNGADPGQQTRTVRDAETGSQWNFAGCATEGTLAGKCLTPLDAYKDYWFDWMNHHPATKVFRG